MYWCVLKARASLITCLPAPAVNLLNASCMHSDLRFTLHCDIVACILHGDCRSISRICSSLAQRIALCVQLCSLSRPVLHIAVSRFDCLGTCINACLYLQHSDTSLAAAAAAFIAHPCTAILAYSHSALMYLYLCVPQAFFCSGS